MANYLANIFSKLCIKSFAVNCSVFTRYLARCSNAHALSFDFLELYQHPSLVMA